MKYIMKDDKRVIREVELVRNAHTIQLFYEGNCVGQIRHDQTYPSLLSALEYLEQRFETYMKKRRSMN